MKNPDLVIITDQGYMLIIYLNKNKSYFEITCVRIIFRLWCCYIRCWCCNIGFRHISTTKIISNIKKEAFDYGFKLYRNRETYSLKQKNTHTILNNSVGKFWLTHSVDCSLSCYPQKREIILLHLNVSLCHLWFFRNPQHRNYHSWEIS